MSERARWEIPKPRHVPRLEIKQPSDYCVLDLGPIDLEQSTLEPSWPPDEALEEWAEYGWVVT